MKRSDRHVRGTADRRFRSGLSLWLWFVLLHFGSWAAAEWSPFEPLPSVGPAVPQTDDREWSANPIDAFIRAALRSHNLTAAPPVDRRTWLRRATYDLIGLPPTPEEIEALAADPRPDPVAYSVVVDRLLGSPQYGERWARHWLDVVRYADTDGFAIDGERPTLWRYRDFLVRAFNEDRPFDQLIKEQLAGDEIGAGSDGLVALGFYRLGPYELDNMVPENRHQDFLNEMTSAIGSAFLGVTLGCARCHDHKYDPLPQADFYRLQAFLAPFDRAQPAAEFRPAELPPAVQRQKDATDAEMTRRRQAYDQHRQELRCRLAAALGQSPEQVADELFEKALKGEAIPLAVQPAAGEQPSLPAQGGTCDAAEPPKEPATNTTQTSPGQPTTFQLSAEDRNELEQLNKAIEDFKKVAARFESVACAIALPANAKELPTTHVLLNGDVFARGEAVQPAFLSAVPASSAGLAERLQAAATTAAGRRRLLAEWIASPGNPLTARVIVNRVWQHHFGTGIVATANDFGANGSGASHPQLLDYLARWFIHQGWQIKPLHRLLVLSRTYRTASHHPDWANCAAADPDNRLLWRAAARRLEAETIRDALLAVSGQLNLAPGGPGFYEALPQGMDASYPFFNWEPSEPFERRRRSIYMFQRRNLIHPLMEAFDIADASQSCERRRPSVTANQALALFNGQLTETAARELARRLVREVGTQPGSQIERLYALTFGRAPDARETVRCLQFLSDKSSRYQNRAAGTSAEPPEFLALRDLCLVCLNANEFLYLD